MTQEDLELIKSHQSWLRDTDGILSMPIPTEYYCEMIDKMIEYCELCIKLNEDAENRR
jgi:hypothetical protein